MTKALTLLAAAMLVGCAAPVPETEEEHAVTVESALSAFNPCSTDWQIPMSYRWALDVRDSSFLSFEDRLQGGGSMLVGSLTKPKPYRAIVHVDVYLEGTKTAPHSGLWYLAVIPAGSRDARNAVAEYAYVSPVNSRELGYCLADGSFLPNKGNGPGNVAIKSVVAMYDPRCVCTPADGSVSTWTTSSYYWSTPSY